ncbi:hypothetical protein SLS60_005350 [Paraconiothyrium brasiliense]|uniref:5-carboxymethyl-2-hydroxymuconate isomerase n=1 Tax=Paraconiothyrium brasiliense TaxID=300254 RepID=A0ABR3RH43_9PLEO
MQHKYEYLRTVKDVSDHDLASFDSSALEAVRVGEIAYGYHLFDKVKPPALDNGYIHIRIFISAKDGANGSDLEERVAKLARILTEEMVKYDGEHVYRAIFGKDDTLGWFET